MLSRWSNNTVKIMAVTAGVICFLVYLRALSCGFINWDDGKYVLENTVIRKLDRNFFETAFTSSPLNFWIPLTWISFAVDYHYWGLNPFGYHLTNIILHAVNTGIVLLIANRVWSQWQWSKDNDPGQMIDGKSFRYLMMLLFTTLLWAVHPARVESVVWVTERKDVLNGLFTFSSILFYLRYVQGRATGKKIVYRDYAISLLLFLLSLMSKPTSVLLPLMLLVIDWYPLGRLNKNRIFAVLLEKMPYLLLGAAVGAVTVLMNEQYGAYIPIELFPLEARVVSIGNSLFEYIRLMITPLGILPYYHLPMHIPQIYIVKTIAAVCFITFCLYAGRKRPWISAVIISFIIPLLPVLQFFPNGFQAALCVRYTYLPSLFPCIILSGLVMARLLKTENRSFGFLSISIALPALLIFYVVVTENHIGNWKNSGTYWSKVIEKQPFDRAYFYRALYYVDTEKNYPAALIDYTTSLKMFIEDRNPDIFNIYAFRGEALAKAGRYSEAVKDFDAAISLFPHRLYYYYRGYALLELGKIREAEQDLVLAGKTNGQLRWFPSGSPLF